MFEEESDLFVQKHWQGYSRPEVPWEKSDGWQAKAAGDGFDWQLSAIFGIVFTFFLAAARGELWLSSTSICMQSFLWIHLLSNSTDRAAMLRLHCQLLSFYDKLPIFFVVTVIRFHSWNMREDQKQTKILDRYPQQTSFLFYSFATYWTYLASYCRGRSYHSGSYVHTKFMLRLHFCVIF